MCEGVHRPQDGRGAHGMIHVPVRRSVVVAPDGDDPADVGLPRIAASTIQVRHLYAFVVTARELHFTRASVRLHVAQQTLSQQIRQLEVSVGCPLFDRSTRRVALTPAGELLLRRCEGMLDGIEAVLGDLQREGGGETGLIRLAYTPAFVDTAVAVRDSFLAASPDFSVSLVECWTEQAVQGVRDGTYQAGIIHTLRRPDDLALAELGTLQIGAVVSSDDPLAKADVLDADMLADKILTIWPRPHSPVLYDTVRSMFEAHFAEGKVHEFGIFARGFFLDDSASLELVASGRGFSPAAEGALRSRPAGFTWRQVTPLSLIPTSLIYRESAATDPGVAGLISSARRHANAASVSAPHP